MAKIYVALIRKGFKTLVEIPEEIREKVKKTMENYKP